jgi:hypothetical protein
MKRIGLLSLVVIVTVLVTLAFSAVAAPQAPATVFAAPAAPAVAVPMPPHPHIDEALEAMHSAKHHLEQAVPEFHGHRAKAIEHLDAAIHEADICMREP